MFDVEAIFDIVLTRLTFRVYSGSNSINIYSAPGSYSTIVTNRSAWTLIASASVDVEGECSLPFHLLPTIVNLMPSHHMS